MQNIKVCYHCSATREGSRFTFDQCKKSHIKRFGGRSIGYNLYVEKDGSIHFGRPFGATLAHAKGFNKGFIAICYEGGLDANGKPKDTRTEAQKQALLTCDLFISRIYKVTESMGHRDLSPDKNGDGQITKNEWMKLCPCFDVKKELS